MLARLAIRCPVIGLAVCGRPSRVVIAMYFLTARAGAFDGVGMPASGLENESVRVAVATRALQRGDDCSRRQSGRGSGQNEKNKDGPQHGRLGRGEPEQIQFKTELG